MFSINESENGKLEIDKRFKENVFQVARQYGLEIFRKNHVYAYMLDCFPGEKEFMVLMKTIYDDGMYPKLAAYYDNCGNDWNQMKSVMEGEIDRLESKFFWTEEIARFCVEIFESLNVSNKEYTETSDEMPSPAEFRTTVEEERSSSIHNHLFENISDTSNVAVEAEFDGDTDLSEWNDSGTVRMEPQIETLPMPLKKRKKPMLFIIAGIGIVFIIVISALSGNRKPGKNVLDGEEDSSAETSVASVSKDSLNSIEDTGVEDDVAVEEDTEIEGRKLCRRRNDYDSDGNITGWVEYSYDSRENEIKEIYYRGDGSIGHWYEFSYNNRGNKVKEIHYGRDGSMLSLSRFRYDSQGNEIEVIVYDGYGRLTDSYEFSYDSQENEVKIIDYNRWGIVRQWKEKSYDGQGNEIKVIDYGSDGSITSWEEKSYDDQGNEIKVTDYGSDGSITSWKEKIYDDQGNEIKVIDYGRDGNIKRWEEYIWEY